MEHARCGMGAGAVGNKLIVCGGYGRGECLDSVEQFDPVSFTWKRLPDMPTQRFVCDPLLEESYSPYGLIRDSGRRDQMVAAVNRKIAIIL